MLQYDLQRAADKLINEMFQLKEGENVVISADTSSSMEVVDAVASSARAAGGRVMVVTFPTPGGVGQAADPDIPVDAFTAAVLSRLAVDGTEKFCFKSGAAEMEEVVRFAVQIAGETAARKGAFPILPPEDCKSRIENR